MVKTCVIRMLLKSNNTLRIDLFSTCVFYYSHEISYNHTSFVAISVLISMVDFSRDVVAQSIVLLKFEAELKIICVEIWIF